VHIVKTSLNGSYVNIQLQNEAQARVARGNLWHICHLLEIYMLGTSFVTFSIYKISNQLLLCRIIYIYMDIHLVHVGRFRKLFKVRPQVDFLSGYFSTLLESTRKCRERCLSCCGLPHPVRGCGLQHLCVGAPSWFPIQYSLQLIMGFVMWRKEHLAHFASWLLLLVSFCSVIYQCTPIRTNPVCRHDQS